MFSLPLPLDLLLIQTCSLARSILHNEGEIRLGAMFTALQKDSTKIKYGSFLAKHRPSFRGVSKDAIFYLYEMTLLDIERTVGPLTCHREFDPKQHMQWGYSRKYFPGESIEATSSFSRFNALQSGNHPDAPFFAAGLMPDTIWSKRSDLLKRAA